MHRLSWGLLHRDLQPHFSLEVTFGQQPLHSMSDFAAAAL
jgi:hypothetical protein